MSIVLMGDTPF